MGHILARDICVDFPIFTNSSRSMKNIVLRAGTGGRIAKDAANSSYVRSLDHLTFEIRAGERIGLMGHNGSGKTTLLRTLCGVYAPTAGRLSVHRPRRFLARHQSWDWDPDRTAAMKNINAPRQEIVMGLTRDARSPSGASVLILQSSPTWANTFQCRSAHTRVGCKCALGSRSLPALTQMSC